MDELELFPETEVTETALFHTAGYDRYRNTLPGELHEHLQRGRKHRPGAASDPPPMPYDELIGLVLVDQNQQTVGQLFDLIRFCEVLQTKE